LRAFVWDASPVPLDEFLPEYDFNEVHSTRVRAAPAEVLAAARALTSREVPLARALMAVRTLPARLRGPQREIDTPIVDGFLGAGFALLAERSDELVLGGVGRFWLPSASVRRIAPEGFAGFGEPGWAKAAFNFEVSPAPGGGTLVVTETRIRGTDEAARRSFGRYWRVIHPGSALIRRAWLRAIRRRAERGSLG
jgi:hypothetical protein